RVVDDGAFGNTLVGSWSHVTTAGYAGDLHTAAAGAGGIVSTWTFTGLPSGQYSVQATWNNGSAHASNAPFTLYADNLAVGTAQMNQKLAPRGWWHGARFWGSLGSVSVTGGNLVVKLTNAANGQVVADAVRIERVVG